MLAAASLTRLTLAPAAFSRWSLRSMSGTSRESESSGYDGPGKTTVDILNEDKQILMVDSFSVRGFRLNNDMMVYGPIALFPTAVLCWSAVGSAADVTPASMALFRLVNPRPDVLVVGLGEGGVGDRREEVSQLMALRKTGLNVELLPTEHAIATYNYLCAEGRLVAAALIPPDNVRRLRVADVISKGQRWQDKLFQTDKSILSSNYGPSEKKGDIM